MKFPSPRPIDIWARVAPILYFLLYLNFSVAAFAFGPWAWPVKNGVVLYSYLMLAHASLVLGYGSAVFARVRFSERSRPRNQSAITLVIVSLAVNIALLVPTALFRTGTVLPNFRASIEDLGQVYYSVNMLHSEGGSAVEYARVVLSPITSLLVPLTIFYWSNIRPVLRYLALLSIGYYLAIYVAIGTNKAIADFVILLPCLVAAQFFAGRLKITAGRALTLVLLCITISGLFFHFFGLTQSARTSEKENRAYFAPLNLYADLNNVFLQPLPMSYRPPAASLFCYLNQGYYALGLSLDKPFVPMYGVGNSIFLAHNAAKVPGWEAAENLSYPMRLWDVGWDGLGNWASIYPWLASDVTFPGTLIIVFLIGRFLAQSWLDTLQGANPFGVAMFAQFALMIYYFPANNQVMQSGEGAFAFIATFLFWQFTRRRWAGSGARPLTALVPVMESCEQR